MVCSACGYVMSPFDRTCPRCNREGNDAETGRTKASVATEEIEETTPRNPWVVCWTLFHLSLVSLLSFAMMFCLCSLLFALLTHLIKGKVVLDILFNAKSAWDVLFGIFREAIKAQWFMGVLGGIASAYPSLRKIRAILVSADAS